MRIVTVGMFAGFILALTTPSLTLEQERDKVAITLVNEERAEIDPVVTGQTISEDHLAIWEENRKRYLECPECVASQPFPDGN